MSYTPTTTRVRNAYVRDKLPYTASGSVAEFNRFIEQVRAEAKAEALREAADKFQTGDWHGVLQGGAVSRIGNGQRVTDWLRARAEATS